MNGKVHGADEKDWTGGNLDILRGFNSECIDLIYLDPSSRPGSALCEAGRNGGLKLRRSKSDQECEGAILFVGKPVADEVPGSLWIRSGF
ncbi:MAG: hypothetical protein F4069_08425 [Rhodothermaceae bacterium]|nr:hypothetical protein [Rhodothermaceae bacterium]MXZ17702.1 hypothetical protein [Rhodothermaceae bacterium]MYC05495.1 hypothetical protein [Rhodothermaceae bacterium]MYG70644.1 hypothetical protein [Rhodothermaceae bacterium]MYI17845.1 hypothetical protein [Rhodothermaceae bacterium]